MFKNSPNTLLSFGQVQKNNRNVTQFGIWYLGHVIIIHVVFFFPYDNEVLQTENLSGEISFYVISVFKVHNIVSRGSANNQKIRVAVISITYSSFCTTREFLGVFAYLTVCVYLDTSFTVQTPTSKCSEYTRHNLWKLVFFTSLQENC